MIATDLALNNCPKLYFLRNEAKEKVCEDTTGGSPQKSVDITNPGESSPEKTLREENLSPDVEKTTSDVNERVVPLAPQEEDVDDDIISSDSTTR